MKNMIILKNLPSNMVEEAYVVFKNNVKIHKLDTTQKSKKMKTECQTKEKEKNYMVSEAEMIINNYISEIENKEYEIYNGSKKLREKYKRLKALCTFLIMFSALSLALIILR